MTKVRPTRKHLGVIDTSAERAASGGLFYPQHPIGLWLDTAEGPAPCLLDVHSFGKGTEALATARAWALQQPGNSALVYHRESGRILARYVLTETGSWGYLLYSPHGKPTFSQNAHFFPPMRKVASCNRSMLIETFTADAAQTSCDLPRAHYRAVLRRLIKELKEHGKVGELRRCDTLGALLQHFHVGLEDEVGGNPEAIVGTLCFPADYYDATVMRLILAALAPFIYPGSCIRGRWGKKECWTRFHRGDFFTIEDDQDQGMPSGPTFSIPHPDGAIVNVHSLEGLHATALDILLWRMLCAHDRGEYEGSLEADFDPQTQFVRDTIEAIVPKPEEDERLRDLLAFEPTFFTNAWTVSQPRSLSPAYLTHANVSDYIETLYQFHWWSVIEQARALL
jgi:hypothetical protein